LDATIGNHETFILVAFHFLEGSRDEEEKSKAKKKKKPAHLGDLYHAQCEMRRNFETGNEIGCLGYVENCLQSESSAVSCRN
jgi:hypothetical protein